MCLISMCLAIFRIHVNTHIHIHIHTYTRIVNGTTTVVSKVCRVSTNYSSSREGKEEPEDGRGSTERDGR